MATVLDKETPLDEILRRLSELELKDKEKDAQIAELHKGLFYLTDSNTAMLGKQDLFSSQLTWSDNRINILDKRFTHHINTPKWHYEGQPVIK